MSTNHDDSALTTTKAFVKEQLERLSSFQGFVAINLPATLSPDEQHYTHALARNFGFHSEAHSEGGLRVIKSPSSSQVSPHPWCLEDHRHDIAG